MGREKTENPGGIKKTRSERCRKVKEDVIEKWHLFKGTGILIAHNALFLK